ncbi:hypothetical protein TRIATDRAFT_290393 [Trichoderma atroviride IMI 206040]|uniref:Uncharacterized protein n=1 Tax=Hypocrea atroviridis (strain ATCC 20476 / IMI 206040) TaxID=452589 RepID=G9NLV7_HYPAI|nr:uncharacterized protein TRIATDRAFT_290393 [Trichoderma atroviride IMI 206040]EHK47892.1 hypothetical protein TRIATDRAFT_290393 [Trichoderma atroviride IMI 206040]
MSILRTYFLCPTSEFIRPPPDGSLFLGSIIPSTSVPESSFNRETSLPLVNVDQPVIETDWKKTVSAENKFGFGVYAQFLKCSGLGPEVDFDRSSKRSSIFAFDEVTTVSFQPTPEYVTEAMKAPTVQYWLNEPRQRFSPIVSLYLVTGMKLVKGANIKYSSSESTGISANIGVNIPSLGLTFGPKGSWSRVEDDETEFNRTSEFIFAFSVKRLRITRKVKIEEYHKGAFLSIGKDEDGKETDPILVDDVDGSSFENAAAVHDSTENESVYCVPCN